MDTTIFAPRTDFRKENHPVSDKAFILGLDLGYSAVKCFYEKGVFCVPNFVREIRGEIVGQLGKSDIIYINENNRTYAVGDKALKSLKHGETVKETGLYGRNHYIAPEFLIMFRTALGLAMWDREESDTRPVYIQTGLPPAYLTEDEAYLRSIIEGHHEFQLRKGEETRTFAVTIDSKQVDVIIQPMGTLFSIGTSEDGKNQTKVLHYLNSKILIFDGGFGTLDTYLLRNGSAEAKDTDETLGMRRVLSEARNAILRDHPNIKAAISIPEMQECLNTGRYIYVDKINMREEVIDITSYIWQANNMVREEAFNNYKDMFTDVDYIVMTGGIGAAWCKYFSDRLRGLSVTVVPGNDQCNLPYIYANARGYFMARYGQIK